METNQSLEEINEDPEIQGSLGLRAGIVISFLLALGIIGFFIYISLPKADPLPL